MPFSECSVISMPGGTAVGDQGRHADAEVDVVAVAQVARDAAHDAIALIHSRSRGPLLDPLLVAPAPAAMRFTKMPGVCTLSGSIAPGVDELLDFGDRVTRGRGHHGIEVARGLPVDAGCRRDRPSTP